MDVSFRRATLDDVPFLAALAAHADVEPFLAVSRASTPEAIAERVARSQREPDGFGVLVIEADGEPVGTMSWELVNRRSRIAAVSGLAVDPGFRERGVGIAAARALQRHLFVELGFHRLQMEVSASTSAGSGTRSASAGCARVSAAAPTGATRCGSTASSSGSSSDEFATAERPSEAK